jgi:cysteine dioxygenase
MRDSPLQILVRELGQALRGPSGGSARVAELLGTYSREHAEWRDYARFKDECYSRNLVSASQLFELLVICWNPGQVSPIHDHQGQRCWMAVLDGAMRETQFHARASGPLREGPTKVFQAGSVAFIQDDIALHEIAPAGTGCGVTLHLYSKPIRECRIFERETGQVSLRGLAYHSVEGVLQA